MLTLAPSFKIFPIPWLSLVITIPVSMTFAIRQGTFATPDADGGADQASADRRGGPRWVVLQINTSRRLPPQDCRQHRRHSQQTNLIVMMIMMIMTNVCSHRPDDNMIIVIMEIATGIAIFVIFQLMSMNWILSSFGTECLTFPKILSLPQVEMFPFHSFVGRFTEMFPSAPAECNGMSSGSIKQPLTQIVSPVSPFCHFC